MERRLKDQMYTRHAREYEQAIEKNIFNAHFERPSLLAMLPDVAGCSVLDLGCGPGVYTDILLRRGATVTAVDISREMIERVTRRFGAEVRAYLQDLNMGLPKESDASYELVLCPLAIHYVEELTPLFCEIGRVLTEDGRFIFSTHHPMVDFQSSPSGNYFTRELVTESWDTIGKPVEVQFFRRSLTELFSSIIEAGLTISRFNEGRVGRGLKEKYPAAYERLRKQPQFMFVECKK